MGKCHGNLLEGTGSNIFNCFSTIVVWLIILYVFLVSEDKLTYIKDGDILKLIKSPSFIILIVFYLFYLILQFTTTGFRKFIVVNSIHEVLRTNIENTFKIKYHGLAWHTYTTRNSQGNDEEQTVYTFDQKREYNFKSGCDYTVFDFDSEIQDSRYLDLEIEFDFLALDQKTFDDEEKSFKDFSILADCDESYRVSRIVDIEKTHTKNIIAFTNYFFIILDRIIFIISILLTFGQVYKFIMSCFMGKKKIKILKIISNYYDLTQSDSFFNIQPKITLLGEHIKYSREKYAFKHSDGIVMFSDEYPLSQKFKEYDSNYNIENVKVVNNKEDNKEEKIVLSDNKDINIIDTNEKKTEMEELTQSML